jgi:D-alanyl-D-alanine carboxypeptidase
MTQSHHRLFDAWLRERFTTDLPGISVIACLDGKTVFRAAYGKANVELGVDLRPEHVMRIGSITKQFASVAILLLMERGKLALSDSIAKYVPRFPMPLGTITLEHLLTHTSGVVSYTDMPESARISRDDRTLAAMIDFFKDQPPDFAPGARWQYSNSGYLLLGAAVEAVSGQRFDEFLQARVFKKLGMADTRYDTATAIVPNRATGYSADASGLTHAGFISMTQPHAAGALLSTVDDLAKWDAALAAGRVLKLGTLKRAWVAHVLPGGVDTQYGYGWSILRRGPDTLVEHGGGIPGFATFALRIPERRLFVAALANSDAPALQPLYVVWRIAQALLGETHAAPVAHKLSAQTLAAYCGRYKINAQLDAIFSMQRGHLHAQFGEQMPPLRVHSLGADVFGVPDSFLQFAFERGARGAATAVKITDRGILRDVAHRIESH